MWKTIILDVECIVCNKTLQKIKHDPLEVSRKMVRIASKRARTPNWSPEEKQFLLELIKEHKEVVVAKSNNGPNHSEEKDVAWNEILRRLADKFGNKFFGLSIKKVKTQWQNMKRIAREEITLNGDVVHKYSKQSLEVCSILDIVKDGILKKENEFNETAMSTNVEIKTECIEDDNSQPCCSNSNLHQDSSHTKISEVIESSTTVSEPAEIIEDGQDDIEENQENIDNNKSTCSMTEPTILEDNNITNVIPFNAEMHEFLKYSTTEKHLKLESLKEERQVFRAMRETAELNKIIAEQKLKHILWMKNREMAATAAAMRQQTLRDRSRNVTRNRIT